MHDLVNSYSATYLVKLTSNKFSNYMALELLSDLIVRQSGRMNMHNALLRFTWPMVASRSGGTYITRYSDTLRRQPSELDMHNALLLAYLRPTGRYKRSVETELRLWGEETYRVLMKTGMYLMFVCYSIYLPQFKEKYKYWPIMVISTRANFAVITAIITSQLSCTYKMTRLSKVVRDIARMSRESTRTAKMIDTMIVLQTRYHKCEGNFAPNYRNVEISTRDVFAVNKAIQTSRLQHLSQSTRLFERWRGKAKGSRQYTRTLSSPIYVRLIRSRKQNARGNYIPNYDNVVISTRDVFAVI